MCINMSLEANIVVTSTNRTVYVLPVVVTLVQDSSSQTWIITVLY